MMTQITILCIEQQILIFREYWTEDTALVFIFFELEVFGLGD